MATTENVTVQTNTKRQDMEEMIKLFLNTTELGRARIFGYAQGVESMTGKMPERQAG